MEAPAVKEPCGSGYLVRDEQRDETRRTTYLAYNYSLSGFGTNWMTSIHRLARSKGSFVSTDLRK